MGNRTVVIVGDTTASGFSRNEVFVDASGISKKKDDQTEIPDLEFNKLLVSKGQEELLNNLEEFVFECEIDFNKYEYGKDYYLGDIVKAGTEYGFYAYLRITEIIESDDNQNGYKLTPSFEIVRISES